MFYSMQYRAVACALCLFAHISPSQAQEDGASTLPMVVVSAQASRPTGKSLLGLSSAAIDVPFSLSSVTVSTLQDQGGTTLLDLLRNVPGAQADLSFNGSHAQVFVLRGFLADSGTGASRILRDGARLSNYPFVPAFVDSVQVLRGPGAAVATRSEPGGTVQQLSKQPLLRDAASVSAGIGLYGARETSADINRLISAENALAARLIVSHSEASEWRGVPDRLDGAKLVLAQSHGERYHLRAGVELINQRYMPDVGVPGIDGRPAAIPVYRQLAEPWDTSSTRSRVFDLHADVALGEGARWFLDATHLEADSTVIRQSLFNKVAGTAGTFNRVVSIEPGTTRRIDSIASALSGKLQSGALTHQLYAGVEYYREVLAQPTGSAPVSNSPPIDIFHPVYGRVSKPAGINTTLTRENLESAIVTVQDQLDWQRWSVVAGAQFMRQRFFYGTTGSPVNEQRWSPKLALLGHWSAAQTAYASVSTGTSPNQAASATSQSLPSRTSRQYELGWKSAWLGGRLRSDAALFWLQQNHMLADDPSTVNPYDKKVTGQARSKGLEWSLDGRLTRKLSLVGAYAYTNARFLNGSEFQGKFMPNVAAHTLSLFAHYDWDGVWRSGLGAYAQGRRYADEANTTILPGYARLDATQSYLRTLGNGQSFELQLSLRNLLDKHYYAASHLHVTRNILPGETRTVMLSGTYHF
ncbi:TonB-dependent receptor [Janthinobacterium sp. Mn2066]|uniref:TonB-dependent receptor n=1 Tax=Janthinobacterium sp. Mn2066 TaxID=3395264 RepID=UPI003BDCE638